MVLLISAISLSLSVSFFCSLMEACLLSLSNTNIAEIAQKSSRTGTIWKQFKSNIQKPIAVILIINTLAHTIGAAISGAQFDELFGPRWIIIFSIGYSLFMIQYTEILPKTLGVRYNTSLARVSALPLLFLTKLFRPFIMLIETANSPFEKKVSERKMADSIAHDITLLASSAVLDHTLSPEQATLISKSIQMSVSKARDIMVDREDIVFLVDSMSLNDAFLASHIHRHTRYPLFDKNDESKVLGYVNFKDIITALHIAPEDPTVKGISRPILFISESMSLNTLLRKMIRERQHIAIVQDTKERAIGLVTMEDVIESLVGDIEDEFDRPPEMIIMLTENRWRIGGGVTLAKLRDKVSKELPDSQQTIDQLIKAQVKEEDLKENTKIEFQNIQLKVRRIVRGYVYDVVAEKMRQDTRGNS